MTLRVIALASQLSHFPGIFAVIAAIVLTVRRAVTGWMLAFLSVCHGFSWSRSYRDDGG